MLHLNYVLLLLYVLAVNKISMALDIHLGILLKIFPVNIFRRIFVSSWLLAVQYSRLEIYYQRVKLTRNGVYYTVFDYSKVDTTMYQ